jgi:hypothetical protein
MMSSCLLFTHGAFSMETRVGVPIDKKRVLDEKLHDFVFEIQNCNEISNERMEFK